MPSKLPALIDYLVAKFAADATLGQATPPVAIFDGPVPAATELPTSADPPLKLYIGLTDPDSTTIAAAATFAQSRADMGAATRDETSVINCCAEAWSGDDTVSAVRHQVFGIIAAVEALVRADNTAGGLGFQQPGVTVAELLQNDANPGAIARVPFTITVRSFT